MYGLNPRSEAALVARPGAYKSGVSLTIQEAEELVDRLLSRKERNNGVGRYLKRRLREGFTPSHSFKDGKSKFRFIPSPTDPAYVSLVVFTERVQKGSRKQRVPDKRKKTQGGLHWHFPNHDLHFEVMVRIVAQSTHQTVQETRHCLMEALDEEGVARMRLPSGFCFEIRVACFRAKMFDLLAPIQLRTSKANKDPAYRRLRSLLKRHFKCVSRARNQAADAFREHKKLMRLAHRFG